MGERSIDPRAPGDEPGQKIDTKPAKVTRMLMACVLRCPVIGFVNNEWKA